MTTKLPADEPEPGKQKLGELLIEQALIDDQELAGALTEQAEAGGLLGEVLVRRGLVSRSELRDRLVKQLGAELAAEDGASPRRLGPRTRLAPVKTLTGESTDTIEPPGPIAPDPSERYGGRFQLRPENDVTQRANEVITSDPTGVELDNGLKNVIRPLERCRLQLLDWRQRLAALEDDIARPRRLIPGRRHPEAARELAAVREEINTATTTIGELQQTSTSLVRAQKEMRSLLAEEQAHARALETTVLEQERRLSQLHAHLEVADRERGQSQSEWAEATARAKRLEHELAELVEYRARFTEAEAHARTLDRELAQARMHADELETEMKGLYEDKAARLATIRDERKAAAARVADVESRLAEETGRHAETRIVLEYALAELTSRFVGPTLT
jgi:hypothetical protein